MKKAFTLTEVLITLGIIGVVTAISMPTLIQTYQKQATCNKLKKMYNNLNNIAQMAVNDNGEMTHWDFSEQSILNANSNFYKTYFEPYLITIKKDLSTAYSTETHYDTILYDITGNKKLFQLLRWQILPDGSSIAMFSNAPTYFWIFADINGPNRPNRLGKDVFMLSFNFSKNKIDFWGIGDNNYRSGSYGCSKEISSQYAGGHCGAWIMKNNWQIPDDYPW